MHGPCFFITQVHISSHLIHLSYPFDFYFLDKLNPEQSTESHFICLCIHSIMFVATQVPPEIRTTHSQCTFHLILVSNQVSQLTDLQRSMIQVPPFPVFGDWINLFSYAAKIVLVKYDVHEQLFYDMASFFNVSILEVEQRGCLKNECKQGIEGVLFWYVRG